MNNEAQKKYKDTVFRLLFKEPKNALSLYNSLSGTDYTDAGMLEYNTLENAIFMNMKNDLSFVIAHQLNIYEHQSTVNPNMPLRDLLYAADVIQKIIKDKSLYGAGLIKISTPSFVVFYNGTQAIPEKIELKLSDAYESYTNDPALELKVTVLNINKGMNEELKKKCPVLGEYMAYVEKVREYAANMKLKDAVKKAVDECISENILKDFLMTQKAEVSMISLYEYDEERELQLIKESWKELGLQEGREEGRQKGREEGRQEGREEGREEGRQEAVISICLEFGCSKEQIVEKLMEKCRLSREQAYEKVKDIC